MRKFGFILLIFGIIGIIIKNIFISCICTIIGSVICQTSLIYKHKHDIQNCSI